jgi:hypothetical protein
VESWPGKKPDHIAASRRDGKPNASQHCDRLAASGAQIVKNAPSTVIPTMPML